MLIKNLLLIAGNGNKSGKTTFACRIIEQFRHAGIMAIKITPHFHETTTGLVVIEESEGYSVYEETDAETNKDTSRMLKSGASRVFYAKVTDNHLFAAFLKILENIPPGTPVVCESPALRYFAEPGLFVIMMSDEEFNKKNINRLLELPHVMFHLSKINKYVTLPIDFSDSKWIYKK